MFHTIAWFNEQSKEFKSGFAAQCLGMPRVDGESAEWLRGYDLAVAEKAARASAPRAA